MRGNITQPEKKAEGPRGGGGKQCQKAEKMSKLRKIMLDTFKSGRRNFGGGRCKMRTKKKKRKLVQIKEKKGGGEGGKLMWERGVGREEKRNGTHRADPEKGKKGFVGGKVSRKGGSPRNDRGKHGKKEKLFGLQSYKWKLRGS